MTYGGYSSHIVVDEHFVLTVPKNLDLDRRRAAALRRHHHLLAAASLEGQQGPEGRHRRPRRTRAHGSEDRHAMGAHVVLFTTSPNKKDDANRLGANEVVVTRNPAEMEKHVNTLRLHSRHAFQPTTTSMPT